MKGLRFLPLLGFMWQFSSQWWWFGQFWPENYIWEWHWSSFSPTFTPSHASSSLPDLGWDWGSCRDSLALLRKNHVNFFSFSCWWCISFFRCQQSRAMCQLVLWMRKQVYYQIWLCRQGRLELWQGAGVVKLSFYRSNPGERTTVPAGIPYSTQHITHIFHIPHIYSHTNRSSPGERLTGYHKWIQIRKFPAPRKSWEIVLCENKILPSSFTASPSTH